jgi:hypothetical protein
MKHKLKATITFEYEESFDNVLTGGEVQHFENHKVNNKVVEWAIDSGFEIHKSMIKVEHVESGPIPDDYEY